MDIDTGNNNIVAPNPALILESLRSIGYSLENAIADIIDNSISAGAENIWFDTTQTGEYIMISDDGEGMAELELINSLRFGSLDPLLERELSDLGRFGLGLKLASLSYCRKLTVASKTETSGISIKQWDLDHIRDVGDWELKSPGIALYPRIKEKLESLDSGTVVYWENIDRFIKDKHSLTSKEDKDWYAKQIEKVCQHLQMVFHRFIDDEDFSLYLPDGDKAEAWDPFLTEHPATRPLPSEQSILGIAVQPYILPHKSKFRNESEYKNGAGSLRTWARAQGFYVYRGKRLITAGSWLGLPGFTKSHETDLARIQLDISNMQDEEWMLDVKKSTVKIPRRYRDVLKRIAKQTRDEARKVRLYRGKVSRRENPGDYQFVWSVDKNRQNVARYRINRSHPVIESLVSGKSDEEMEIIEQILRMIEETVPTQNIILEEMKNPDSIPLPYEDVEQAQIIRILKTTILALNLDDLSPMEMRRRLLSIEPFSEYEKLVDDVISGDI